MSRDWDWVGRMGTSAAMVMGAHKLQRLFLFPVPAWERYSVMSWCRLPVFATDAVPVRCGKLLPVRGIPLAPPGLRHVGYGSGAVANVITCGRLHIHDSLKSQLCVLPCGDPV